ncbi:MAG: alpha/beta fold hydrolase [Dehalococcoidia bacterium]
MQQPRIQYVQIAYTTFGQGPPLVFAANAWGEINLFLGPENRATVDTLANGGYQVILYDGRGQGSSDRNIADMSQAARLADLEAVVDRLALERFALMALVHGCTTAITYAATHPERVSHLILWSPYTSGAAYYSGTPVLRAIKALSGMLVDNWEFFTLTMANWLLRFQDAERAKRMARVFRNGTDPQDYVTLIEALEETDVTTLLPQVEAPTLVIRDTFSVFTMPEFTRAVAAGIPGAHVVTIDNMPDLPGAALTFLRGDEPAALSSTRPEPSAFRTVLFTDLVGHTEMMTRLGDDKGRDVLREHERITREVLAANGGTEVKTMGDGFMASFGSVTKAVECAVALQRAFAEHTDIADESLHVRVGLNAGEPIEEDGPDGRKDLFGATVILASRIAAKAAGGEILVANAVRELCAGKGFLFSDRGEFTAKGFDEPVRVYDVKWRDDHD